MNLGQLIRTKRKEKGLTQGEVAAHIDVSTNTISKYERNIISNMGREKVIGLSKLLDIPTVAFIEAIDELGKANIEQMTRKEFATKVLALSNELDDITDQEKALLEHVVNLISSKEE